MIHTCTNMDIVDATAGEEAQISRDDLGTFKGTCEIDRGTEYRMSQSPNLDAPPSLEAWKFAFPGHGGFK